MIIPNLMVPDMARSLAFYRRRQHVALPPLMGQGLCA